MAQFKNLIVMTAGILGLLMSACGDKKKNFKLTSSTLLLYHTKDFSSTNKLHVLYAERDSFKKVGNNGLYLTYFLDAANDSYTLHGWPTKKPFLGGGIKFDTLDKDIVILLKGDLSSASFSDKMYLSPPFLDKHMIKEISTSTLKYVCFYPGVYKDNTYGQLIKYTMHFSDTPPVFSSTSQRDTTYTMRVMTLYNNFGPQDLNPSPPKQDF